MKILLIDNHDSFTYNLLHLIRSVMDVEDEVELIFNDQLRLDLIPTYQRVIISPGPGLPSETENLNQMISMYGMKIPILGICLGHQAIAESYGATIYNMPMPAHGLESKVQILNKDNLFQGVPDQIFVGRYHSWSVSTYNLPECLTITAISEDGCIMGISHKQHEVHGVQFHPESFLTPTGKTILSNFLKG